jgi:putative membrane protein
MSQKRNVLRSLGVCAALATLAAPAWAADDDADFVAKAASGGMLEVELGRHAAQNATDPSVRQFGERMVSDHGKANQELKAVAQGAGLAVPAQMNDEHRKMVEKLSELRGPELDKAYMDMMVEDHDHDVDAFRDQAEQGESAVDRWAAKTLPTLEAHLQQAKSVANRVEQASPPASRTGDPPDTGRAVDPASTGKPARP